MPSTITSISLGRGREAPASGERPQLIKLITGDDPHAPSSRHLLDDIDEVRFGRGPRAAVRSTIGHRRVLELSVPDPRMSSQHGRLVHGPMGWILDDPSSKNGAIVGGNSTRHAVITDGAIFELGHTFFAFRQAAVEAGATADSLDGELDVASPMLATFVGALADSFAGLARVAPAPVSVVILGETGTGKEVIARALHEMSGRTGPFVAVNCGALPASLVEAELFGHRRGAFTGAINERPGLVRSADGGTLFLDEIAELPPASQAALLRVLQEREVVPVGDDRPIKVDVRVCAATHRDLSGLVERGAFRRDLYARLVGLTIELPPLRRRQVDFGILLRAVLARVPEPRRIRFTSGALRTMIAHDWPLNIRELEKVLLTAAALAGGAPIDASFLELVRRPPSGPAAPETPAAANPRRLAAEALRARLVDLLTLHEGNVLAVSRAMGARRTQIYRWAHRLEIDLPAFRRRSTTAITSNST